MTSRPRVDFVNLLFFDGEGSRFHDGGAERYVLDLARMVRALGGEPRILQNATAPFTRDIDGIEIVGVPVATSMDFEAASQGFAAITSDADLVVASPEELACRLPPSPPVIAINHGIHWDYVDARLETFDPRRFRRLVDALTVCRACVCVDTNFINWLRALDTGPLSALRYIPNYVDLTRFRPTYKRFDDERLAFLFPRRLCMERGFRHLVTVFDELLPRLPQIDLHVCGSGGEEDERLAAAFVARHPGRVRWSKLPLDGMPAAYATSHVVLVPTVVAEGTSLSAIEGMATNNALVATFVGGLPNVVVDGLNGMLIRPAPEALANAVERLAADRELVARFARNGLGVVPAFSRERWDARWQQVLSECVPAFAAAGGETSPPRIVPRVSPANDPYEAMSWSHAAEAERPLLIADRERLAALRLLAEEREAQALAARDAAREAEGEARARRDALTAELEASQRANVALATERDVLLAERDAARGDARVQSAAREQAASEAATNARAASEARTAQLFAEQQLAWRDGELAGIKNSTGWAVLQWMYKVRFTLFPRDSGRERAAKWLMHRGRAIAAARRPIAEPAALDPAPQAVVPQALDPHGLEKPARYTVVCLPILEWNFRMQRPQQLVRRFARKGHAVLFAKHSFGDALSVHPIETNIDEVELPGTPGTNPYRDALNDADAQRMADALLAHLATRGAARFVCIVQLPFWAKVVHRLREVSGCDVVYDCMDLHSGFSSNTEAALAGEQALLEDADLVVCASQHLLDHAAPHAKRTALVRNGVDYEHFAQVEAKRADGVVTIGYYGAIADWFDSDLVAGIARLRPQWRIVLIGSTWSADTAPLIAAPNVTLTGEQPYAELPKLIADWDCCIIPFKHTPLTEATNPVKVYEMLAAAKPVVSVGLPELLPMGEAGLVALAEGPEAFIEAIEVQIAANTDDAQAARRVFAAANTWEARAQAVDAAIDALMPQVSVIVVTYNNRDLNELCLTRLFNDTDYPDFEVIVVDNASIDGTPDLLRELAAREPRLRFVLNPDNKGFAAANNQGAAVARGRYLCFLNNDTVVHGAWLRTLVGHLRARASLGLVGPVTNAIGNEAKIPVGYDDVAGMPAWADAHCAAHRGRLTDVSMLAFFCVALPRWVWHRVGPLDERFGAGMFEDDDYNRRVRAAGFDVGLAWDSFVHHWQRASFKLLGEDEYLRIYRENQARYASKWLGDATTIDPLVRLRQAAANARGTVIFAPSVGWAIPLAQRPHHIARVLAADGYTVVFDCTNAADDVDVAREIEPGLFLYKGPAESIADLPQITLWTFSYNYGYRDAFPSSTVVVYDWIDDLSVFPHNQRRLAALHGRALREADVILSVARRLHDRARHERPDAIYAPNAVESGRFEREPVPNPALSDPAFAAVVAAGRPIAGYYGALAHWFDYDLLSATARLRADWSFVLIGPDHDGSLQRSHVAGLENVYAVGTRAYSTLPGYLHRFDAATIPFLVNDITLATSPLKLYEYFAAARPVISTDMPECSAFDEVQIVHDAATFSAALDDARRLGANDVFRARVTAIATRNTWTARTREIMRAVASRRVSTSPPPVQAS